MGLFNWLKKKDQVPEWAHGLDNKQFHALWQSALAWFTDHGVEVTADEQAGSIHPLSGFLQGHHLNLTNLARSSVNLKPEQISNRVAEFFQGQWDTLEETALIKSQGYERAKSKSRIRLFANDPEVTALMAGKDLNLELTAVISLDLSRSTVTVPRAQLSDWGVEFDEAFEAALEFTVQDFKETLANDLPLIAGRNYGFELLENFFVSSVVLGLPSLFQQPPQLGILAGVPSRSALLCLGIDQPISMKEIEEVGRMNVSIYQQAAGAVSPGLYWLYESEVLALSDEAVWEKFCRLVLK